MLLLVYIGGGGVDFVCVLFVLEELAVLFAGERVVGAAVGGLWTEQTVNTRQNRKFRNRNIEK